MSGTGDNKKWQGYSAYQEVASQLHKDVNKAIRAYATIKSLDSQNVGITPQTAVKTKRAILAVAKRTFYEVQVNRQIDEFDEIYERWSGNEVNQGETIETGDTGYVARLEEADFREGAPEFLPELMDDLVTATWKLGYIRAGVEKPADPDDTDEQMDEMFE